MGEGVELPKTELPKTKLPKTERSNILIWLIKLVLIGIIIAAVIYLINSLLPDNNNQELNCGDPNQDGSNRIYVCPSGKTLKLPPNDNLCTGDTCTDTDCCVDIPSVDSSSVRVCQRPSSSVLNNYNMTNVQENDLNMDSFDVTGITCNTGYSGTAVATVCTRPGGHYTVSGCTSSTGGTPTGECIRPLDTTGYNNIVETSLSMGSFEVSAGCAVGYTGTATTRVCDVANEAYTLDGCSDIDGCRGINCGPNATCRVNIAPDTGYTCSCNTEYTGTDVENGPATCTPTVCSTGRNIPQIFGTLFGGVSELQDMSFDDQMNNNPCEGTAVNTQCNLDFNPCPNGYIGGTITCQADGSWDVVNCEAVVCNTEPVITDQHMSISAPERTSDATGESRGQCTGANPGETCAHQCDAGYTGGSVTCVRDGDIASWNIEACTEVSVAVPPPGGFTWILGETGEDCDATCTRDGVHTCSEEGFWGVDSADSFREKMALANYGSDEVNGLCPEQWSYNPSAGVPYISSSGHCFVSRGVGSTCSYSQAGMRRLCRCT